MKHRPADLITEGEVDRSLLTRDGGDGSCTTVQQGLHFDLEGEDFPSA